MKPARVISFILQFTTIGIAVAFILLIWRPSWLTPSSNPLSVPIEESTLTHGERSGPVSYADAVAHAAPAVVNIYTRKRIEIEAHPLFRDPLFRHFFGEQLAQPQSRDETSLGSGVIISSAGYLLTNHHVVERAEAIEVMLSDGRTTQANIVGTDPEADLAILHIGLDNLPNMVLGHSDQLRVGDVVLAIGNPFGVGQTVTQGIVSALGRNQLGINTFENFIQTDAAINPGNSGGALINAYGELVGINTAIYSESGGSQGIGFAIPISLARVTLQQIIEHGRVQRGWLGIQIQPLSTELAHSFGLPEGTEGVLIAGIEPNSPAAYAGLQVGDLIQSIDGVHVASVSQLLATVSAHTPGTRLTLSGIRASQQFTQKAITGARPTPTPPAR